MNDFPELKSQKEIDGDRSWNVMKWYIGFSFIVSAIISVLMIVGLVKWIFFV